MSTIDRGCNSVGIDLGTTYSSLAYLDDRMTPRIVPDSSGQSVTPSVIYFDDAEVIVGEIALQNAKLRSDRVMQFIKTRMGDEWKTEIGGREHTPESLSAMILAHLVREAEPQIGAVSSAVITVPAFFTEKRRFATQQAGEIAGLKVIGLLNEPVSAALAYGLFKEQTERTAVIYDLGGGTFDVTVVRISPNKLEELATAGNRQLGGKDWDQCLINLVAEEFRNHHGKDPLESAQLTQDFILQCEQAKRQLTRMGKTSIRLNAYGHEHVSEIMRDQFEDLTAHLLQTTRLTTEMAIEDAGLSWQEIDRVVLVGGSTHMPMVRTMLKEISGKPPDTGVNPVLAVALGAAIYAQMLESGKAPETTVSAKPGAVADKTTPAKRKSVRLHLNPHSPPEQSEPLPKVAFVTAHGVGVKARVNGKWTNVVLIQKNTPVPCEASQEFRTFSSDGNLQRISIHVTQGDTANLELAERLGKGTISEFPAGEPAGHPVVVRMSFNEQGRLNVRAVYKRTGQKLKMTLEIPGGLAPAQIRQYQQVLQETGLISRNKLPDPAEIQELNELPGKAGEDDFPILEPIE